MPPSGARPDCGRAARIESSSSKRPWRTIARPPNGSETFVGDGERLLVLVDPDDHDVAPIIEDRRGVTSTAHRRVDDDARRAGAEEIEDLVDHHCHVEGSLAHPQLPDRVRGEGNPVKRMEMSGEGWMLTISKRSRGAADGPGNPGVRRRTERVEHDRCEGGCGTSTGGRLAHDRSEWSCSRGTSSFEAQRSGDHSSTWS